MEQDVFSDKIDYLKGFILLEEENIKKELTKGAIKKEKKKTQRRENIRIQKSVITNALNRFDKRTIIANAFATKSIRPGDLEEYVYYRDEEPKFEERTKKRKNKNDKTKSRRKRIKNINSTTNA